MSRKEIYEIERRAFDEFLIPPLILMENAGREIALESRRMLSTLRRKEIVVLAGRGNNGGDGMVAARYLHCWGFPVSVFIFFDPTMTKEPSFTNYRIVFKMGIPCESFGEEKIKQKIVSSGLVIDALFGIGLSRPVEAPEANAIEIVNNAKIKVLSVDIPSGIDADSGDVLGYAIKADITVTFGFAKKGLYINEGKRYAGKIKVVDIGYPPEIYM
ncbi:MAG TPA: NAD(P)H-hydrate epimerase [bacterium]|nr:NAD(P)H-hydrate epimerase [bacterium]HQL65427.1 NAD(P)H-hydrate epimerase [bacterium]